uniref:PGG domain-containing protein n=1 Tax=Brassica oleracea var. oleracea TaxID=109376 RepID=A0A0D2ZTJ1_BRAOL
MDCSEARTDKIEAQRLTGVSHDIESVPDFLTNLRLSDLYNLPGEYVEMHPEIFSAMRAGNIEYLERMKSYGTPMACLKSDLGDSVLHLAAAWGHLELVKSLVSECPSLLLESNGKGQLPLHVAARAGHSAVVEALILSITFFADRFSEEGREKLNLFVLKDEYGDTPLHLAFKDLYEKTEYQQRSTKSSLSHLIMHCFRSISISDPSTHLMETAACLVSADQRASFLANKNGISPLYLAIEAGNVSLVNAMLNRSGNNVQSKNLTSELEGRKSLVHAALMAKSTDVLDVILSEDTDLLNERDEEGRTCLSVGASMGYYKGICKVLDRSTNSVYERDEDGSFPIHMAVKKGHEKVVREILKRCPDSVVLINKQGQNILHIAAKSGKAVSFLLGYIRRLYTKYHLINEQDVDGNTPLHLATINWRPRTVDSLTSFASTTTNILNIQNKDGLRPLDLAELNLQSDYYLRERLTLMVLLCVCAPRGVAWLPTSGMTLRSRSEHHLDANKYKDHINALLLVAALVATVTFAAGFTIPGGFNSSAPDMGMAVLAYDSTLFFFLVLDTLAMQSSVVAIVALIWALLGDPAIVHRAFHLALPSLFLALLSMSWAFVAALQATIKQNSVLINVISITSMVFYGLIIFLLAPYVIPQVPGFPFLQRLTRIYLILLLIFVNEDDSGRHYTSGSDNMCVKSVAESVGSSGADQVGKSA